MRHWTLVAMCLATMAYVASQVPWASGGHRRAALLIGAYLCAAAADAWLILVADRRSRALEWDEDVLRVSGRAFPLSTIAAVPIPGTFLWIVRERGGFPSVLSFRVFREPRAAIAELRRILQAARLRRTSG